MASWNGVNLLGEILRLKSTIKLLIGRVKPRTLTTQRMEPTFTFKRQRD